MPRAMRWWSQWRDDKHAAKPALPNKFARACTVVSHPLWAARGARCDAQSIAALAMGVQKERQVFGALKRRTPSTQCSDRI